MRHQVFGRKLNRDVKEREALFKNLATELILRGKIHTTYAKAKAVVPFVERLITHAKKRQMGERDTISKYIIHKEAIVKFQEQIVPVFIDVAGGYTSIQKSGKRMGDGAEMVLLQWSRLPKAVEKKVAVKKAKPKVTKKTGVTKKVSLNRAKTPKKVKKT